MSAIQFYDDGKIGYVPDSLDYAVLIVSGKRKRTPIAEQILRDRLRVPQTWLRKTLGIS